MRPHWGFFVSRKESQQRDKQSIFATASVIAVLGFQKTTRTSFVALVQSRNSTTYIHKREGIC